ncbi:MAG: dihydrodipicolinate synthase family protein [Thermoplasmata archaeon]
MWDGVWPAVTTPFRDGGALDEERLERKVRRLLAAGCPGVVVLGTLGEAPVLSAEEKEAIVRVAVRAAGGRSGAVTAGVSGTATEAMVAEEERAARAGAGGLMLLPPYVYHGDAREVGAHFDRLLGATGLPSMLYNNPIAHGTDVPPEEIARLAGRHPHLRAVKESSGLLDRFDRLGQLLPEGVARLVGIDGQILEGIRRGASGWVAGLANALPEESVALFRLARDGAEAEAGALERWFRPLLAFDSDPKLVQKIKLVEELLGAGPDRVRAPRLPLAGEERGRTIATVRERLAVRPRLG